MTRTPKITTAPTGSIAPFGLRMLPELKEKIEEAARASGRSMNAEIVARLLRSFSDQHLAQEGTADLARSAEAIGYKPGTPAYEGAIEALKQEVRLAMQEEARSFLGRVVEAAEMQKNAPEAFKKLLDSPVPPKAPTRKPKP